MNARFVKYIESLTPSKRLLAREAVNEYLKGDAEPIEKLVNSVDVYNKLRWLALEEEEHAVVILCKKVNFIKHVIVGKGSQTETCFDVRKIIREALLNNATSVIIAHNHPSGDITPSTHDMAVTDAIKKACDVMQIKFIDHVIIANGNFYSFRDEGRL